MKKNLRIVSAAAAALLAVAPVAASTVNTASADTTNASAPATTLNLGGLNINAGDTIAVNPSITLVGKGNHINGSVSASVEVTVNGNKVSANLNPSQVTLNDETNHANSTPSNLTVGRSYTVTLNDVVFSTGVANKNVKVSLPSGVTVKLSDGTTRTGSFEVGTNSAGNVTFKTLSVANVKAINPDDVQAINFFERSDNAVVTSGNVTVNSLVAGSKLNVSAVVTAISNKYVARQAVYENNNNNGTQTQADLAAITANEVKSQLTAQGITVDGAGYFTAPKSFTINYTAHSDANNASATLPVTVNVPNGSDATTAGETSVSAKVMYKSAVYDKDGKNTGKTIAGYTDTNFVAENGKLKEYTINGGKFYKIANEDGYVRARNVTGSKMTLKKNAYVYKSNGKRTSLDGSKKVSKGTEVTVYGGKYKAIKGYKGDAVRVGVNKYIKVANVNYKLAD